MDDAYWDAFRLLTGAQQAYDRARALLGPARQAAAAAHAQSATLATAAAAADGSAAASHLALDRLVVDLYQYGPPITAASALLGAPEDFLQQVDTAHNQDVAAGLVVGQANASANAAALARVRALAAGQRASAADALLAAAESGAARARADLAAATSALGGLAVSAPQARVGPDGCPTADVAGTLRGGAELIGAERLCRAAVAAAATPQAALALTWAFAHLGAAYACGGAGRMLPWRMDCSSLVSRAYHEGAGLAVAGSTWAPSTRDMVPWGGATLDPHYAGLPPQALRPGDLVLYDTGGTTYRHVVIYLGAAEKGGQAWMLHTNSWWRRRQGGAVLGLPGHGVPRVPGRAPGAAAALRPQEPGTLAPRTMIRWSRLSESNRRPSLYKSDALTS